MKLNNEYVQQVAKGMNLRELLEFTSTLYIEDGGLSLMLERLVDEIEKLKEAR
jgi:hypothetical protein